MLYYWKYLVEKKIQFKIFMSKVPKKLLIFGAYGNLGKIISKDLARNFKF